MGERHAEIADPLPLCDPVARALKNQPSPQALLFEMGIFRTLGDLLMLGSGDEREWAELGGRVPLGEEEEGEMEEGERDRDAHARIREVRLSASSFCQYFL